MIVIVLGMHKSGTTLVSQILHHSGINMDDDLDPSISYDRGNKYERQSVLRLDLEILGTGVNDILGIRPDRARSLTESQRWRMREIIEGCQARYPDWGIKEPRMCLTYPLWREELPSHLLVGVYRTPLEIWPRFRYNGIRHWLHNPLYAMQFIDAWMDHNQLLLELMSEPGPDRILLNYRRLMTSDEEFRRLEHFLGRSLEDMRRPQLYRSRDTRAPLVELMDRLGRGRRGTHLREMFAELESCRERQLAYEREKGGVSPTTTAS